MLQTLCIHEQMVSFKGNSSLKQYIPSKPHKYGYKIFVLCCNKGFINYFELCTGKIICLTDEPDLGASSNIVLQLSKVIPPQKNHLLFFDNWFMSIPLLCHLAKSKTFCLEIVRSNRLRSCNLPSNKDIKKKGRETTQKRM